MLHRSTRRELVAAARALPRAAAADDRTRLAFTDLAGSTRRVRRRRSRSSDCGAMLDLDVAGWHPSRRPGSRSSAPEGIASSRSTRTTRGCTTLVGWDEKFAAHNAALWKHGLLVHVPKGVELEQPLYVRIANSVAGRLALLAAARRRRGGLALHADRGVRVRDARPRSAYTNAVAELFVEQAAKLEYVSIQNLSRETWHFATHHARVERDAELDWVAGGFGSKNGQDPDPERPRRPGRDLARHRRVLRRRRPAPRLRHVPGAHRAVDRVGLRVQGRAARVGARRCGAG